MRQILVNDSEYGICMFHSFNDFKAVCDTIRRNKLLDALNKFKIPLRLIRLVTLTLKHVRRKVKIQNNL